jgi:ligand-binding sensor domain-containing protein
VGGDQMKVWAVVEESGGALVEATAVPTPLPDTTPIPTFTPTPAAVPSPAPQPISGFSPLPPPDAGWEAGLVLGNASFRQLRDIAVDPSGRMWFATDLGIDMLAGGNWITFLDTNSDLLHNHVTSVAFDSAGRPWIGTEGGVNVIEGTNWRSYTAQNSGLPPAVHDAALTAPVEQIVIDSKDHVWFSTAQVGLARFDGRVWTNFGFDGEEWGPLSASSLGCLFEALAVDGQDRLWVGAPGGGVFMVDGAEWHMIKQELPTTWTMEQCDGDECETRKLCNISDRSIKSIAIDAAGNVWTGSLRGVERYDGQMWTGYNAGLPEDLPGVKAVALAPDGRPWAVTIYGDLFALGDDGVWIDYTEIRPFANLKMMNDLVIDSQGRLWFGDYVLEPPGGGE